MEFRLAGKWVGAVAKLGCDMRPPICDYRIEVASGVKAGIFFEQVIDVCVRAVFGTSM